MNEKVKLKNTLFYNIGTVLIFEIIYKLFSIGVITPIVLHVINIVMKLNKIQFITLDNLKEFLINPMTIISSIGLILIVLIFIIFEISTLIIIFDMSSIKKKINIVDAIKIGIKKVKKLVNKENIVLFLYILIIIPINWLGIYTSYINKIIMPEFVLETIFNNNLYMGLSFIGISGILFINIRWLYVFNFCILEDVSFKEACKNSKELHKNNYLKNITIFILLYIAMNLVIIIIGLILLLIISGLSFFINKQEIIQSMMYGIIFIEVILGSIVVTPLGYGIISYLFYKNKYIKNLEIKHILIKNNEKQKKININMINIILSITVLVVFEIGLYIGIEIGNGKVNKILGNSLNIEVTAHRGDTLNAPENTLIAFKEAKNKNADWLELDVRLTKDNKIVVVHDNNLKRILGISNKVDELNYEDILKYNVKSYFEKYKEEKIALLEDVLKYASENDLKLNIELKQCDNNIYLRKQVIDLINKYNLKSKVVLSSFIYDELKEIKQYDKDIQTAFLVAFIYGDVNQLVYADNISIEATWVTKSLIKNIHKANKKISVWTVNSGKNINKMIYLGVDNIITDDIEKTKELIKENERWHIIDKFLIQHKAYFPVYFFLNE